MAVLNLRVYDGLFVVDLDQVLYFEADDHYCQVCYFSGFTFMLPFGLSAIEHQLLTKTDVATQERLQRLGRKYIVNRERIHQVSTIKQTVTFVDAHGNKISIKISKQVMRDFLDEFDTISSPRNPTEEDTNEMNI